MKRKIYIKGIGLVLTVLLIVPNISYAAKIDVASEMSSQFFEAENNQSYATKKEKNDTEFIIQESKKPEGWIEKSDEDIGIEESGGPMDDYNEDNGSKTDESTGAENRDDYTTIEGTSEVSEAMAQAAPGKWILSNGKWWYAHTNGTYTVNGWEYINGKWYYFDEFGWMETGWVLVGGRWYYLKSNGAMAIGWILDNNKWYYCNSSGVMQKGWLNDGGK